MEQVFFSKEEANGLVGLAVQTTEAFGSAVAGTSGSVVGSRRLAGEDWVVCVKWNLPRKRSHYFAMLGDFSFNLPIRGEEPSDEFTKDQFEHHVQRLNTAAN